MDRDFLARETFIACRTSGCCLVGEIGELLRRVTLRDVPLGLPQEVHGRTLEVDSISAEIRCPTSPRDAYSAPFLQSVAGRLCAADALRILGRRELVVARAIDRSPVWPTGIVGSISHTEQVACAVVCNASDRRAGVGIDVEQILSADSLEAVTAVCLRGPERLELARSSNPLEFGTAVFSLKEAFYKAIYPKVRRMVEFEELYVVDLDFQCGTATLLPRTADLRMWAYKDVRISVSGNRLYSFVSVA